MSKVSAGILALYSSWNFNIGSWLGCNIRFLFLNELMSIKIIIFIEILKKFKYNVPRVHYLSVVELTEVSAS